MYIAKKFQYRLAFQSTFNRFSNFSISINYRVSANHFGKREPGRGQFFVAVLFPVPRKMLLKAGRFPAAERCAPRPFPFPDDSRRGEGVTGEEGNEGASRGSEVGTQRGAVFFFTRSIAGISHKSREKPGAFEPLSFIVSTTSPSHDSNLPLLLALPLHLPLPLPTTRSLPQTVAFAPLSMALRLTTNFSSRPTFLHPRVLVYGAKLASSRSLRGYHFFVARGWRDREVQWLAPQSQLTVIIKRLRFIIKRLEKILNEKKWRERVVRCLSWTFVCRAIFISQKKKKSG